MDRERMFLVTGCVLSILGAFRMKLTRHTTRFVKTGPLEACQTYRRSSNSSERSISFTFFLNLEVRKCDQQG